MWYLGTVSSPITPRSPLTSRSPQRMLHPLDVHPQNTQMTALRIDRYVCFGRRIQIQIKLRDRVDGASLLVSREPPPALEDHFVCVGESNQHAPTVLYMGRPHKRSRHPSKGASNNLRSILPNTYSSKTMRPFPHSQMANFFSSGGVQA